MFTIRIIASLNMFHVTRAVWIIKLRLYCNMELLIIAGESTQLSTMHYTRYIYGMYLPRTEIKFINNNNNYLLSRIISFSAV